MFKESVKRILVNIEIIVLTRMFWQKIDLRPVQFPAGQTEKNKGSIIIITQHIIVVLTHASAKLYTFQSSYEIQITDAPF